MSTTGTKKEAGSKQFVCSEAGGYYDITLDSEEEIFRSYFRSYNMAFISEIDSTCYNYLLTKGCLRARAAFWRISAKNRSTNLDAAPRSYVSYQHPRGQLSSGILQHFADSEVSYRPDHAVSGAPGFFQVSQGPQEDHLLAFDDPSDTVDRTITLYRAVCSRSAAEPTLGPWLIQG